MRVTSTPEPLETTGADVVAVGVFAGETPTIDEAAALITRGEARGTARHLAVTHVGERPLVVVGLGPRERFDDEAARRAGAVLRGRARELGARHLALELPGGATPGSAAAFVTGCALADYRFTRYQPAPATSSVDLGDGTPGPLDAFTLAGAAAGVDGVADAVARASVLADAQNRARDLGNTPANVMTPAALASYAVALAAEHETLQCEVVDEEGIRARGMGAFAAVAASSPQPAQLITLRYEGPGASPDAPRLALIGKAVTFDSGGLNLKPGPSMIGMKFDMCGGAAVIEAVAALAALDAPVRILAVIGATENVTGGAAMKPGDVLTAYDGTTIEMNNADAEGRLVLADCITHARREGCDEIVDVATLTGAIVVALGTTYAGLMGSDDALAQRLLDSGLATGERLWRLPLDPGYAEMVKGSVAQLSNLSEPPRQASAITAGEFLHHFAGDVPWAHLDIAGVAEGVKRPYYDKGATGFGVRLLAELALGTTTG